MTAMSAPSANDDETRRAITEGAADDCERKDSQVLYEALRRHRDDLGGAARVPVDAALSDRILTEARSRSAEIRARRPPSSRHVIAGRPLPWWLIIAWVLAATAFGIAWVLL